MRITIDATEYVTEIDGVPVRIWEGLTDRGIPCKVMVHRVVVRDDQDCEQFDRELREMLPPGRHVSLRMIV